MKFPLRIILYGFFFLRCYTIFSQELKFNRVFNANAMGGVGYIKGIAQDKSGYIWFSSAAGLYRYDGQVFTAFHNKTGNKDSVFKNTFMCLAMDSSGMIWLGTSGLGIAKYDPVKNIFTSFQNIPTDTSSLVCDTINYVLADHLNNLWIATSQGLDRFNPNTGKFIHYRNDKNNASSLSNNYVNCICEDGSGILWFGCGFPYPGLREKPEEGGLNRFDPATGKFIGYHNIPGDTTSLVNNKVMTVSEDSKGNFWVGTSSNGLHIMNRSTGKFSRFGYDPSHPDKLSGLPLMAGSEWNTTSFIREDRSGGIWIGSFLQGINRYDPQSKTMTHYGTLYLGGHWSVKTDMSSGFNEPVNNGAITAFTSSDGTFWVGTVDGSLYKIVLPHTNILYHNLQTGANSFYEENDSIVWIGTSGKGLDRRNMKTGQDTWIINNKTRPGVPPDHDILGLRADAASNLWIASYNGLYKLNLQNNSFTQYKHKPGDINSPADDSIQYIHVNKEALWMGTSGKGLDKMNLSDGRFIHYGHNNTDSNSIADNTIICIDENIAKKEIWVGTGVGLDRLDQTKNIFSHYLKNLQVVSVFVDAEGMTWAGTAVGLFFFDAARNLFVEYANPNAAAKIKYVLGIMEDDKHSLWINTMNDIVRIDKKSNTINFFDRNYGVHINTYLNCDNLGLKNGQLLVGDQEGYYIISPSALGKKKEMFLNFISFKIGDEEIIPQTGGVLGTTINAAKEIRVNYRQNVFSFNFSAIDYDNTNELKYLFRLENYDDAWRDIGTDHKAYFFNVPPGNYIFHVKAIDPGGTWIERSISIVISPPWWRTWWAYTIFIFAFASAIWVFIHYRSLKLQKTNRVLEEKVNHRTEQLKKSLEDLKLTQAQLIQSEKMASLGELTAGIAHEIQNPLNFVNNFSEVNTELIEDAGLEMDKGNIANAKAILNDIKENEQKINHHGKRADAIVKGMLQHSRSSNNRKEPANINAIADEYVRLAYHGLRAKNNAFNATIKTQYDEAIGNIMIIPQDIGRVILNLVTNAFYAVNEKKKRQPEGYEPTVSVITAKLNDKIEIKVRDNGDGISPKVVNKIFQPFFTTKPTGEGTGLGLSLSYDIIKAHGGELKVETREGEGAGFVIVLPVS
jgi:signal transduction histidine kinase/ligand-binding sensor domain-containing protein